MKLLVAGGAGFIGSAYVRQPPRGAPRRLGRGCSTSSPTPGRRENLEGLRDAASWSRATSPTADAVAAARSRAATRSSTSPPSRTSTARSSRPASSSRPTSSGPSCCSRPRATAGIRHLQVSTDEVYGSIESGSFTESLAARPLVALLGVEGRRRPDRRRLPPHLRRRGADRPRLQQLRPAPAPREADPALHPQRARRRPAARLRRRHAGAQLAPRRRLLRRDRPRARARRARRGLQRRRPRRAAEHRGRASAILELTGRDESLIEHVDDRLGHDRRYSLSSEKLRGRSAGRRRSRFDEGIERTVAWYRDNEEWWGPIRSGEYREYYERQYGRGARLMPRAARDRARRRSCCVEPESTATSAASWSRPSATTPGASSGSTSDFVQDNHSRSAQGTSSAASTSRPRPGQAKLVRCVRGRDLRRRRRPAPRLADLRPVGGPRARRREPPPALRPGRLRARLLRPQRRGRRRLQALQLLRPRRPRPGSPGTTPRSGSSGRSREPQLSERDTAPRLSGIAAEPALVDRFAPSPS